MNYREKQKIIQQGIQFLKKAPNGKKSRRKSYLKVTYLDNQKVFFDMFIAKFLQQNINDQYRRMKVLPTILPIILKSQPIQKNSRYIFTNNDCKAIIQIREIIINNKKKQQLHLLSFFPQ